MIGGYVSNWYLRPEDVIANSRLTDRETWVVTRFLGLENHEQYTIKELALVNGVTTNRIKSVLAGAFEKITPVYKEMRANDGLE